MPYIFKRFSRKISRLHAKSETHVSHHAFIYFFISLFIATVTVSFIWGFFSQSIFPGEPLATTLQSIARGCGRALTISTTLSIIVSCKSLVNILRDNLPDIIVSVRNVYPSLHVISAHFTLLFILLHVAFSIYNFFTFDVIQQQFSSSSAHNTIVVLGTYMIFVTLLCTLLGWIAYRKVRIQLNKGWISRVFHILFAIALITILSVHGRVDAKPFAYKLLLPALAVLAADHIFRLSAVRWHNIELSEQDIEIFESCVRLTLRSDKQFSFRTGQFFSTFKMIYSFSFPYLNSTFIKFSNYRIYSIFFNPNLLITTEVRIQGSKHKSFEAYTTSISGEKNITLVVARENSSGKVDLAIPFFEWSERSFEQRAGRNEGFRLRVSGPFGTPMKLDRTCARHVFITSDVYSCIPILSVVRSLRPHLPQNDPVDQSHLYPILQTIDEKISSRYEWEPHVAKLSPNYDPFSNVIEPDESNMRDTRRSINEIEEDDNDATNVRDWVEAVDVIGEKAADQEEELSFKKRIVAFLLRLVEADAIADEQMNNVNSGTKDVDQLASGVISLSNLGAAFTTSCLPKKKRKESYLLNNFVTRQLIRFQSVLMLFLNSVKIGFLILLFTIAKHTVLLSTLSVDDSWKDLLQAIEVQLSTVISISLTSAIALEISVLGKSFFDGPGGWVDLFIIIPVIIGSWAFSFWKLRWGDDDENPLINLFIQTAIILPAKFILVTNRWIRVMRGRGVRNKSLRTKMREYLNKRKEKRNRGRVKRIDVLWAVRENINDDWFREEARKLSNKRIRFIPYNPMGTEGNDCDEVQLEEGRTGTASSELDSKLEIEGLDWGTGLTKIMWETSTESKVNMFFTGGERIAGKMEKIFRIYETLSHVRGCYIKTHRTSKLKQLCRQVYGYEMPTASLTSSEEEEGEEDSEDNEDFERMVIQHRSSSFYGSRNSFLEQGGIGHVAEEEDEEEEEAANEEGNAGDNLEQLQHTEKVEETVRILKNYGNFVIFGIRRGSFD